MVMKAYQTNGIRPHTRIPVAGLTTGWLSCLAYQVLKGDVLLSDEDLDCAVSVSSRGSSGNSQGLELC